MLLVPAGDVVNNGLGIPTNIETFSLEFNVGCLLDEAVKIAFELSKFIYMREN